MLTQASCAIHPAGLGVFEYFQLAEALDAEPVWVINNGISHTYSVPAENIWPLVQVPPFPALPSMQHYSDKLAGEDDTWPTFQTPLPLPTPHSLPCRINTWLPERNSF